MATSTWDNVRDDNGGEGSGDVSSTSGVDLYGFSCRNASNTGLLDGGVRVNEGSELTT